MTVNELYDIAGRIDTIVRDAYEFGQNREMLMAILNEYADELRDQADTIAEDIAKEYA
jgi:uncharacterized coiled-coil DUF342 family protein